MTNHDKLKEIIDSKGITLAFIAKKLNISRQALSQRFSNEAEFKAWEMLELVDILGLSPEEARAIFFDPKVDK